MPHLSGLGHDTIVSLHVFLYSYEFVIWPDCFVGHSWYGRIASWDIRVLMVFAPNQALCHWHAALLPCYVPHWRLTPSIYVFIGIFFSVEVCLEGVFPHSVSTKRDPSRSMPPHAGFPPHEKNKTKSNRGWPSSPLEPREGAFELTHGSACIIGLWSGLPDSLISTYIAQFMGCVICRIHYGLKVVFCFRHFTAVHYHHYTRLLTGTEYI